MSKIRKAKKLRQPNVPLSTGPVAAPVIRGERPGEARPAAEAAPEFDYSTTRRELTRIGVLAGSFIAGLVILSFFIR